MAYERTPDSPISLNAEQNHSVIQRTIAKQMLRVHGDKAHMMVLMEIEADEVHGTTRENWRAILRIMDELNGETKWDN